jgi:hypothetical protein
MWHPSFGGEQYNWGRVPNAVSGYNRQMPRGVGDLPPRGQWQRQGHGPDAWSRDYGWEYRGGTAHDAQLFRTEASGGPAGVRRMAEQRAGGLPHGRERHDMGRYYAGPGPRGSRYDSHFRGRDSQIMRRDARARYGMDYLSERWG